MTTYDPKLCAELDALRVDISSAPLLLTKKRNKYGVLCDFQDIAAFERRADAEAFVRIHDIHAQLDAAREIIGKQRAMLKICKQFVDDTRCPDDPDEHCRLEINLSKRLAKILRLTPEGS